MSTKINSELHIYIRKVKRTYSHYISKLKHWIWYRSVYILEGRNTEYGGNSTRLGIFSTPEKAKQHKLRLLKHSKQYYDLTIWGDIVDFNTPEYQKDYIETINILIKEKEGR
jgi:hypothetical protein